MSAAAVTPDVAVVVDRRGRVARFFRRMKNAIARAARRAIDWIARASRRAGAAVRRGAVRAGRASVRGTGYIGRFVTAAIGLALGGVEIVLAIALGFLLGVLTILGMGVMGIYSIVSWPVHGLRKVNRKWLYTTFRWMSQDKDFRVAMPLAVYREGRMNHEAETSERRANKIADRIAGFTGTKPEEDFVRFPERDASMDLGQEHSDKEAAPGSIEILDEVLAWSKEANSAPENYEWSAFLPDNALLDAFKALSEDGSTKKTQAYFVGRHQALADYLQSPSNWDPEDPRPLSLLLAQFKGQQSTLPQKYIREGFNAQVEALRALASV